MPRIIRAGLIQASVGADAPQALDRLKQFMIDKHVSLIEQAAAGGVRVLLISVQNRTPVGTQWWNTYPMGQRSA